MALIKCPKCGKEISDKAPACIHCGSSINSKKSIVIAEDETQKNIDTLNTLATVLRVIFIVAAIICFMAAIGIGDEEGFILFIPAISAIISGIILPAFIKWKALILKNVYDINRKLK